MSRVIASLLNSIRQKKMQGKKNCENVVCFPSGNANGVTCTDGGCVG